MSSCSIALLELPTSKFALSLLVLLLVELEEVETAAFAAEILSLGWRTEDVEENFAVWWLLQKKLEVEMVEMEAMDGLEKIEPYKFWGEWGVVP